MLSSILIAYIFLNLANSGLANFAGFSDIADTDTGANGLTFDQPDFLKPIKTVSTPSVPPVPPVPPIIPPLEIEPVELLEPVEQAEQVELIEQSEQQVQAEDSGAEVTQEIAEIFSTPNKKPRKRGKKTHGLLRYQKWWELTEVELSVGGKIVSGTPIFIEDNTIRVVNGESSYFIPLDKVEYIKTDDGLETPFEFSGKS